MKIKLGEALRYEQPTKYIVASEKYNDSYATPVLTAGKSFILGYTNEESGIYDNLPVIIFDDFTTDIKYVDFPFKVKSSAMKMLQPANENYNLKFFYYLIKYMNFQPTSHQRHWISKFAEMEFDIPERVKQDQIVEKLDKLVEMQSKKTTQLKKYDDLVKSQFIEMFGDRFDKEKIKISDIASATIGLTYKPENVSNTGTIILRSGNIQNNELQIQNDIVRVENIKIPENKFIKENDILMCSRNGSARLVGKSCLISNLKEPISFGAFMTVIRTEYPYFLQGFFCSDYFKKQLTGVSTTSVNQITTCMLNNYSVIRPTQEEENQFADFVKHIDKLKYNDVLMEVA